MRSTPFVLVALLAAAAACTNEASSGGDAAKPPAGEPAPAAHDGTSPGTDAPAAEPPAEPAPKPAAKPADAAPAADEGEWKKTATGLLYQVLAPGTGERPPRLGELVSVSYKGWLPDGHVFDASERHGGPATFTVGELVPGWNEALQLMTEGAKWKLKLAPELGYGAQAAGDIPANSTLYFELELHKVIALPTFTKPDPAAQKSTASGLKYEVLAPGSGDPPGERDGVEVRYACFSPDGTLVTSSERAGVIPHVPVGQLQLAFLREAAVLMPKGARFRCEVPSALCFGARQVSRSLPPGSDTVWELEMLDIERAPEPLPVPAFEKPDESAMTKTASGLLWRELRAGEGASPKMGQKVKVHYAGWLLDGTLFDSSYERGKPAEFTLGQVIPGWNEGLQLMKPGAEWVFVIPAALAYGQRKVGDKIQPGSTLVFRVELISFE